MKLSDYETNLLGKEKVENTQKNSLESPISKEELENNNLQKKTSALKKYLPNLSDIENPKIIYHPERLLEWFKTGECYPLYIEIGLTNACNHRCVFCALDYLKGSGKYINSKVMVNTLKNIAEQGVKSIMFCGEGEPLLHKDIGLFTKKAKEYGLDISITTNGIFFNEEKMQECLPNLSWIKFSIDAGTPEDYALVHGTSLNDFEKLMKNIKGAVDYKRENNLKTVIGAQCLIIPQGIQNIEKLAARLKEIGIDYLILKPYSKHPLSRNNFVIPPEEYNLLEKKLEKYISEDFKILFRKASIKRMEGERDYCECHGRPFMALIEAEGDVIPCNMFHKIPELSYGNLYNQSFSEIWKGEKRKEVLKKLQHKGISECRKGCRLDATNEYLHRLKNPKEHDNFI